jgi:peptide/nickel transport system substrate-binding protein
MHKLCFRFRTAGFWYRKRFLLLVFILFFVGILGFLWYRFFLQNSKFAPTDGGIFTEFTIGTTRNLNPLSTNSTSFDQDLQKLIFAGLLKYDPVVGQIVDGLASLQISENAKTFSLTLKNSAKFSDGKKVTIDDVLFTFETIIQNQNFSNKALRDAFEYVIIDVLDEQTIEFHLPERNVFFSQFLTTPILAKKYFKDALIEEIVDPDFAPNKKPVGAGPFVFENIVPNDDGSFRVFLKKNKYFYNGSPKIEQIVFYVFPDFEKLDFSKIWPTMFSRIPAPRVEKFEENLFGKYDRREYLLPRWTGLFFNLDRPFVDNLNFRKALTYSVDKVGLFEKEKGWKRIDSPFFFQNIENWQETDFTEARKILRDGGYPFDSKLEVRKNGKKGEPISIKMITSTAPPAYSRIAQNVSKTWKEELGIDVSMEILDNGEFQTALKNGEYDCVFFGQNFSKNLDSVSMWHSSEVGKFNLSHLTNENVDFLIDEIRFSGAQSDLFTLEEELDSLVPLVPIATPKYELFVDKKLLGFSETFGTVREDSDRFVGIENWFFEKKRVLDLAENKSKLWEFIKFIFGAGDDLSASQKVETTLDK